MATHVDCSILVEVPVRAVYDQWTRLEDFPRFLSGVERVDQVGDTLTHWTAEIAGVRREWDAAIVEQVPGEKIAWSATTGATNAAAAYFEAIDDTRTRVRLVLHFEPEGMLERVGDTLDLVERRASADLHRFKQFIESPGGPEAAETDDAGEADGGSVGAEQGAAATDDPAAGWLTGYPGPRVPHTTAGAQGPNDAAAGFMTGYPGERAPHHTYVSAALAAACPCSRARA